MYDRTRTYKGNYIARAYLFTRSGRKGYWFDTQGTEAVNGMGCPERSTSTLESNQDLAYAITREGAKVGVEDHIVVKDSITETEHTKIRLVRALVETRDPSSKVINHPVPASTSESRVRGENIFKYIFYLFEIKKKTWEW